MIDIAMKIENLGFFILKNVLVSTSKVNDMNFNGKDISITVDVNIEDSLFNR